LIEKKKRKTKRRIVYKKIIKKGILFCIFIFFINAYYYKKGTNNPISNAVYIQRYDDVINYIATTYRSLEKVFYNYKLFFILEFLLY